MAHSKEDDAKSKSGRNHIFDVSISSWHSAIPEGDIFTTSIEQDLIEVREVTCIKNHFPVYLLLISGAILNLWDQLENVFCFGAAVTLYIIFSTSEAVKWLLFIQELVSYVPINKVTFCYWFSKHKTFSVFWNAYSQTTVAGFNGDLILIGNMKSTDHKSSSVTLNNVGLCNTPKETFIYLFYLPVFPLSFSWPSQEPHVCGWNTL